MTRMGRISVCLCLCLTAAMPVETERIRLATAFDAADGLKLKGDFRIVAEGPNGEQVLRTDGMIEEGKLEGCIDLNALSIDPKAYDLIKINVKADSRSWLIFSLDNYPKRGWISKWYALDGARGAFDWRTVWVDLKRPEEMFEAGKESGMAEQDAKDAAARRVRFEAFTVPAKRLIEGPGRAMLLRNLRFVKEAVHLDWDQTQAPYAWGAGKNLIFNYPLTLSNRLNKPVTAKVWLAPFQVRDAKATVSPESVEIGPGKVVTVNASVSLPAAVAAKAKPLYCELFEARAMAEGLPDSEVTILRSSDPIHLSVTVPVPESKLKLPFQPRRKDLPPGLLAFGEAVRKQAEALAEEATPDDLDAWLGEPTADRFQRPWRQGIESGEPLKPRKRFFTGLSACAWLYDFTGKKEYLDKGTALLLHTAERFAALRKRWASEEVALSSDGILTTFTLGLGWELGGAEAPYQFDLSYGHSGAFNDFDLLAVDMDPAARKKIIRDFILPAAIHMRNQYQGLNNQQNVVNYPILYAGLLTRNWPLVSFVYSAEHGVRGLIQWQYDEDGLCNEGHYQSAAIMPLLWTTELLRHAAGVDLYDRRLYDILHSKGAAAIGEGFKDDNLLAYLDQQCFAAKPFMKDVHSEAKADGYHLAEGVTMLRWNGLSLAMNWGTQIFRQAHDRCCVRFEADANHPLHSLRDAQGGSYTHNCIDQSIVIVDEGIQNSVAADVTGVDVTRAGPVRTGPERQALPGIEHHADLRPSGSACADCGPGDRRPQAAAHGGLGVQDERFQTLRADRGEAGLVDNQTKHPE